MLYVRNYVIFGAVRSFFTALFTVIYKIISVFRLQPLLFCIVAGALAEIAFGWIGGSETGFALFHLALCLCVAYAVVSVVYRILRPVRKGKREKRRFSAQIVGEGSAPEKEPRRADAAEERAAGNEPPLRENAEERPRYYRVRQNPAYVMAEFSDRVELYREEGGRLQYVRTDYKNRM